MMSARDANNSETTNTLGTVVIGGGLSAAHCVHALREGGYTLPITLIASENEVPYERPPLSKEFLQGKKSESELAPFPASWYAEADIDLRLSVKAESIDVSGQNVILSDSSTVGYQHLVLATGCRSRLGGPESKIPGWDLPGVLTLRSLEDSKNMRERLIAGKHLVIVGSGWIGMEVAASARSAGMEVTVLTPGQIPLATAMGFEFGSHVAQLHTSQGVKFQFGTAVSGMRIEARGGLVVETATGGVQADLVLLAIGAVPNTELAEASGIAVGTGVLVDQQLRSSDKNVLAIGDVADAYNTRLGRSLRVEHWDNAIRQGKLAAATILGRSESYDWLPYFFTDQFDLGMEYVGDRATDDEAVIRGDMRKGEFIIFWLRSGVITAGMNVNMWDVNDHLRDMIGTEVAVEKLKDSTNDLFAL